jgi:peptide/nickel transport system permease protein
LASFQSPRARVGYVLLGVVVLLAVLGPVLAPHSPRDFVGQPFASPSADAWLGTDYLGQDVLSRVLWGGWSVLWMSVAATTLGFLVGVCFGLIAAWSRPAVDDLVMGAADVILAFPQIVLALLFVSMLGPHLYLIVAFVALSHAPRVARLTRGVALDVKHREFVEAAQIAGARRARVAIAEVLPNLTTPLLVEYGTRLTWSIGLIAAISFLGFGIQPPHADWGLMLNENRNGLVLQPWAVLAPVVCIAVFAVAANLIAEGLGRALARTDRGHAAR